jgi:hypothetical protein
MLEPCLPFAVFHRVILFLNIPAISYQIFFAHSRGQRPRLQQNSHGKAICMLITLFLNPEPPDH